MMAMKALCIMASVWSLCQPQARSMRQDKQKTHKPVLLDSVETVGGNGEALIDVEALVQEAIAEGEETDFAEDATAEALVDVENETTAIMPPGWKGCCFNRLAETAWLHAKSTAGSSYTQWISQPKNVLPYDGETHSPYCCPCNDGQVRVSASKPCNTCKNHKGLKCQPRLLKDLAKKFAATTGKNTDFCSNFWRSSAGELVFKSPTKKDPMAPCESMCQAYSQAISNNPCTADTEPEEIDQVGAGVVYDDLPVAIQASEKAEEEDDLLESIEKKALSSQVREEVEEVEELSLEVEKQSQMVVSIDSGIIREVDSIHSMDESGDHDSEAISDQLVYDSELEQEEQVELNQEYKELTQLESEIRDGRSSSEIKQDQGLLPEIKQAESLVQSELKIEQNVLHQTEGEMEIVGKESRENIFDSTRITQQLESTEAGLKESLVDIGDAFQRAQSVKDSEALTEIKVIYSDLKSEETLLNTEIKYSDIVDDDHSRRLSPQTQKYEDAMDKIGEQVENLAEEESRHAQLLDAIVEEHSKQDGPGLEALSDEINHDLEHSSLVIDVLETHSFDRHSLDKALSSTIRDSEVVIGGKSLSMDDQVDLLEQESSIVSSMEVERNVAQDATEDPPC